MEQVRIFSRGQANIDTLGQLATAMGLTATVCASGDEAVKDADLIVSSVTYSATFEPFLDAQCLKPGAFAAITDLAAPWKKQIFTAFSRIVVDDTQQEAAMPDKLAPPDLVSGGLADLVQGRIKGRGGSNERTAFVFRGHALGDLALSVLAYRKAGL